MVFFWRMIWLCLPLYVACALLLSFKLLFYSSQSIAPLHVAAVAPTAPPARRVHIEPPVIALSNNQSKSIRIFLSQPVDMTVTFWCRFAGAATLANNPEFTSSKGVLSTEKRHLQCDVPSVLLWALQTVRVGIFDERRQAEVAYGFIMLVGEEFLLPLARVNIIATLNETLDSWYNLAAAQEQDFAPEASLSRQNNNNNTVALPIIAWSFSSGGLQCFANNSVTRIRLSSYIHSQPLMWQEALLFECSRVLSIEGELRIDLRCGSVCHHPDFQSAIVARLRKFRMQVRYMNASVLLSTHRKVDYTVGMYLLTEEEYPMGLTPIVHNPLLAYHQPQIQNPVLSALEVHDVPALYVADPFLIAHARMLYLFFEIFIERGNRSEAYGVIGAASSNSSGRTWTYERVVLHDEQFHLSYPFVFMHGSEYFMVPECFQSKQVRLYRALTFPYSWTLDSVLLEGQVFIDSALVFYRDVWWLFTTVAEPFQLLLFFSSNGALRGPWQAHPKNPICTDWRFARSAGRVLVRDGKLYRFSQDGTTGYYGVQVDMHHIDLITSTDYHETLFQSPFLAHDPSAARKWHTKIHHVDFLHLSDETNHSSWLAAIDGCDSMKCAPPEDAQRYDLENEDH